MSAPGADGDPPPGDAPEGAVHDLGELTHAALSRLLRGSSPTAALVPTGAVEAHGPHLPLATDTLISVGVARRAAALLAARGVTAVVFPPLTYAVTDWAASFTGTVTIPRQAAHATTLAVCEQAHRMGFGAVALVNAHLEPDNIATLRDVARDFEERCGQPLAFADQTRRRFAERLTDEFRSGSCHAGQYETSLVLALRPDLVDEDAARALPRHHVPLHEKIQAGARDFAECGLDQAYCGDPAAATAQEGEASLTTQATCTVELLLTHLGLPP